MILRDSYKPWLWPLFIFIFCCFQCLNLVNAQPNKHRIISLAPSITETIFAIGAAKQLIAVTDHCDYPSEATSLPSVGNYLHTNLEAIVAYQPTLVILGQQQQKLQQKLQQLDINTLTVDHTSLSGILKSFSDIGRVTSHEKQAKQLKNQIELKITRLTAMLQHREPVRTLIGIAHSDSYSPKTLYVAGQHDFYNSLLILAGGINAYQDNLIKIPKISTEGIIQVNPTVIIDLFPSADKYPLNVKKAEESWQKLSAVDAVRSGRVHILQLDYAAIPGPRIFKLLDVFAQLLHPELDLSAEQAP